MAAQREETTTFRDILDQIERVSLSSSEKGRLFEQLMAAYLKVDPLFEFDEVWMWNDYPERGNRHDTGVDLVGRHRDTGELTAIQCKFYADGTPIGKPDVDSFLAASSTKEFSDRLIITTTDKWGPNALQALDGQSPPVGWLRARDLDASSVDWSRFSLDEPEKLPKKPPHQLRRHQQEALDDVLAGFEKHDRGKLIMACGTGKTFTALKIAERMAKPGGTVLFLVPSIALLSQTLREWANQAERSIESFAVCSDVSVGKKRITEDLTPKDIGHPATTDPERLADRFARRKVRDDSMAVVFSTYQSIDVVAQAQKLGVPEFDLIICDEAHRTTGVTLADEDESAFVRVHDQGYVQGRKRLYMTATPRVFGDAAQSKARQVGAVLADMGDEERYGPEFHRLGFGKAVDRKILTDYKVLVLAVDEGHVSRHFQGMLAADEGAMQLEDAAKLIGCWNGLAKRANDEDEFAADPEPMRRAVAFAGNIRTSKMVAGSFREVADRETEVLDQNEADYLKCEVRHVDGTQSMLHRNKELEWLREEPEPGHCRILTNAKCLSEGVDVPALDAVLFLAPRKSQVDVVQSVGRVMRKLEGKQFGYVILPIAVPSDVDPDVALDNHDKYKVVWQVLQALRSHDERMNAIVNSIDLRKGGPGRGGPISVIGVGGGEGDEDGGEGTAQRAAGQLALPMPNLDQWRDAIFARIVKKVGDRRYWDDWARDIGNIAHSLITRITALVDGSDAELREEFDSFLAALRDNLNPQITETDAIQMLAQHMITGPVFDALFEEYEFSKRNPVSQVMQRMIDRLRPKRLESERDELEDFYESVRMRAAVLDDPAARQAVIKDLYESFFRHAFKGTSDRLGIVYTPIEIVDFILKSADEALQEHFGMRLQDKGVHILDPFAGTGSFIVRLIQSELISPEALAHKYRSELHANEIVLLAYYVAAVNIEEAYHARSGGEYEPFEGIVLTDTFQMTEEGDKDELPGLERFPENNERVLRQKERDIRVIIGNPPYSVGQGSGNDNNQNLKYATLDGWIEESYAARSTAQNKNSLYDSYIRAIKWASKRIGDEGVICFVTNGGFIDGNTADGMRKCLAEEFSEIAIYNLRGNQRTAGEQSRKEGGKIFGAGSRAGIAIIRLVKDPASVEQGKILYHDIGDYLSREEKLQAIRNGGSFNGLELAQIIPNSEGDWLNQRDPEFAAFSPIGSRKKDTPLRLFRVYSRGLETGRDAWVYNFGRKPLAENVCRMIDSYADELMRWKASGSNGAVEGFINTDPTRISWSRSLRRYLAREKTIKFVREHARFTAAYRPFCKQRVYFDAYLNHERSQTPKYFPGLDIENYGFVITSPASHYPTFEALMVNAIPDVHTLDTGQFFPRYTYIDQEHAENLLDAAASDDGERFIRVDNITDEILVDYQGTYGDEVTKDDIFFYVYGLLHSPEYRERFQADLKKSLPRIPKVEDFWGFAEAGRKLSNIHLGYESIDPYPLQIEAPLDPDYRVKKMRFAGRGREKDRSTIIYNDQITVSGIPEEAYRYMLGSRSAIEWIMDRYQVKTDKKSGITNDPNDWATEQGNPRYILDLLTRIVRLSLETMQIVDALPALDIIRDREVPRTTAV